MRRILSSIVVILCVFSSTVFGTLIVTPKNVAHAANFKMQTGYYVGTGATLSITGLGFTPDFVFIKGDTAVAGAYKTSAMAASTFAFTENTADNTASLFTLDSAGFTVGNQANINGISVRYEWIAFGGSDCTSSGNFCVGDYTGTVGASRTIVTGFQPTVIMVKRSTTQSALHFHTASMPVNYVSNFGGFASALDSTWLQSFSSTGFLVGTNDNANGGTYHYIAFKTTSGFMTEGTYTGNGSDDRNITGLGFQPGLVITKNATNATALNTRSAMITPEVYGDNGDLISAVAATPNTIQSILSDGFQVGTAVYSNNSGDTFYYLAFEATDFATPSGTFVMDSGTYTGTGSAFSVTGLTFEPQLVIIKPTTATVATFRMTYLRGDVTWFLGSAGANFTGGITSLNSDGFSIGTSANDNTLGVVYHWQAFGNAFNPQTNSGAADFAMGCYIGNSLDNRDIGIATGFQPDFVLTRRTASDMVFRTSSFSGDASSSMSTAGDVTDRIQAFNSNGFQIGTNTQVNLAANMSCWVAFKSGNRFSVGTYAGNGTDNTNITSLNFQPDLMWNKQTITTVGVFRPGSLTGDFTQLFTAAVNFANGIQTLLSNGFQMGTDATVNTNTAIYRFMAWNGKKFTQIAYRLFANADSTDVGSALAATNTAYTLGATGDAFRLRMLVRLDNGGNSYSSGQSFKLQYVDKGAGTCDSPSGTSPSSYTDVTGSTLIAYKDNATPSDGAALTSNANDPTDGGRTLVNQTYEEANNVTNNQGAVNKGQDAKFDFSLWDFGGAGSAAYCFRLVNSTGVAFDTYTVYPQITTAAAAANTLTFSISDNSVGFGALSSGSARYATGDTSGAGSDSADAHTITVSTNATNGYNLTVNGSTLTCTGCGGATVTGIGASAVASSVGTEQFGLRAITNSGNGTVAAPYSGSDWAFDSAAFPDLVASGAGDGVSTVYGLRYLSNISANTEAGTYTGTLTYSVTATF